ncbi:MAG: OmpA family protein [Alteromonadales bacterium]|nr:OmpA family protein [Alteromonadales bacterium]
MNTVSTFKKSVLSIVIISAVTASFISWDKYQPRHETKAMVAFYQNRDFDKAELLLQGMVSADSDTLAAIAEENLVAEVELISSSITESSYSPEADEPYDIEEESTQLQMWQEDSPQVNGKQEGVVIANRLLFGFDSSEVSADYYNSLDETARLMQDERIDNSMVWQVVGYADRSGNYIYNSKLARKRAQAVAKYLVNKGVNEEQLAVISLGTSSPLNEERSIENNRNERRVEIHAYQAEVTALLEQYNKQVEASQKMVLKPDAEITQEQLVVESTNTQEQAPTVNFQLKKALSLTTAMEL